VVTLGDRLPELEPARERQIAVVLVAADRLAGGQDRLGWGGQVGVQVLEPEDVGIVAGGFGDPVDGEPRDALQSSGGDPGGQAGAPGTASWRRQAHQ
jgi:hypothetical protein